MDVVWGELDRRREIVVAANEGGMDRFTKRIMYPLDGKTKVHPLTDAHACGQPTAWAGGECTKWRYRKRRSSGSRRTS